MPEKDLGQMLAEMEAALQANREGVAALDRSITSGNAILRRRTTWIAVTCMSIALDIAITVVLAVLGFALSENQQDTAAVQAGIRANACNLNALFAQSAASSGNTADLYRGLRPLLAADPEPDAQKAVAFIDRSIANLKSNAKIRADFLKLTRDTARRLDCPPGFTPPR